MQYPLGRPFPVESPCDRQFPSYLGGWFVAVLVLYHHPPLGTVFLIVVLLLALRTVAAGVEAGIHGGIVFLKNSEAHVSCLFVLIYCSQYLVLGVREVVLLPLLYYDTINVGVCQYLLLRSFNTVLYVDYDMIVS